MEAVAACESETGVGEADGMPRGSWVVKCSIVGVSDLIQAWHDSNNGWMGRESGLEIRHDASVGLTVARSHHQKQSDKQLLKLHVDHLCMHRVSSFQKKVVNSVQQKSSRRRRRRSVVCVCVCVCVRVCVSEFVCASACVCVYLDQ